jgi:elongation factor 1-beta
MKALEESVRSIEKDGLVWGSSTLIPVGTIYLKIEELMITGFGIKKLQITLVVEDDKVSLEELQEEIEEFEDYVQSTDIVYPILISRTNSRLQWLNCKSLWFEDS